MTIRIVLVDDHELVRAGLRLRLQRETNIEIVGDAPDAATCYEIIAEKAPNLVVMDLELPREDGLVATRTIKARWPAIRVLALTGAKPVNVARAALLAGADGVVFKNETTDDLVRAVRTLSAGKVFLSADAATAIAAFLRTTPEAAQPAPAAGPELSERERAVLKGLADGLSYKELAAELGVGVKSIDSYRARLVKKLGCTTRADLVRYAIQIGLTRV